TFNLVDNLIEKIKENPYILTNIKGIGFKRADEIAKALGIDPKSPFRIKSCLNYTLKEYCDNNGNSSIDKFHLYKLLDDSLRFSKQDELYENVLVEMLAKEEIYKTSENRVALSMLYFSERSILEFFNRRKDDKNRKIVENFEEYLDKKESSLG
ncbi:exodeoxyribonuclease V subunit alpha, partial [Halarcobacter bivalviorum]